ncbi:FlmC family protein (plasmid) [Leclercia adecarboxylata]|nr:FlmC family protein [Leclercia adecarboxylata]
MQGGVNHETAAKRPYLVRINCVFNALDIHMPDTGSLM